MSKEALRRFTQVGLKNSSLCKEDDGGDEDVNMGEEDYRPVIYVTLHHLQEPVLRN